jgi:nucleoside-diphosphate-sugar epimerase
MNPSTQKIIVTGASSFVGCHLTQGLSRINGWNVIPLGSKNSEDYKNSQIQRIEFSVKKKKWAILDLRDEIGTKQFIQKFRPDIWVHHAGHASNYASPEYSVKDGYDTNVAPIKYIFKSLAENGCRGVIVTGSSLEYSNADKACLESDSCTPETLYGQSKLLETLTALEMSDRFDLPTRIVRLFIPFGPMDNPNKLIHYVINRLKNKTAVDLSPCKQKRDFIYIDDVVKAYSLLIKDLDRGGAEIFNVCSGEAISLENIINLIAEAIGAHKGLLNFGSRTMRKGEQMISYGSNYKALETLEWKPGKVEDGLLKLINY